jgi:uncharacterized protein (TIGR02145 family)
MKKMKTFFFETVCILLIMTAMAGNVNAQQIADGGLTANRSETAVDTGVIVISEGREITQNIPTDIAFFNSGDNVRFNWIVPPGGYLGTVSFQWQQSNDGRTWADAPGANTNRIYITQPVTADTYFRRLATDACGAIFPTVAVRITLDRTVWATRNVDMPGTFVANPQDAGKFYQWNRRTSWASISDIADWNDTGATGRVWERANDPCPPGWRVPTQTEIENLNRHRNRRILNWNNTGVSGHIFGTAPNQIFLPDTGIRNTGTLNNTNSGGYWSSTPFGTNRAKILNSHSNTLAVSNRTNGLSVRCVAE